MMYECTVCEFIVSACWSFLSSDLSEREAMSHDDGFRQSLPSELSLTPSPPLPPVPPLPLPSTGRRLPDARIRRLKPILPQPPKSPSPTPLGEVLGPEAGPDPREEEGVQRRILTDTRTIGAYRPASSPVLPGHREPWYVGFIQVPYWP